MKIGRRILKAAMVGGTIGLIFQFGFYACAYSWISFGYEFFFFSAFWPMLLLPSASPDAILSWLPFPTMNLFALACWSLLPVIFMSPFWILFYILSRCRKQGIYLE
jgi:hypothetical protein